MLPRARAIPAALQARGRQFVVADHGSEDEVRREAEVPAAVGEDRDPVPPPCPELAPAGPQGAQQVYGLVGRAIGHGGPDPAEQPIRRT